MTCQVFFYEYSLFSVRRIGAFRSMYGFPVDDHCGWTGIVIMSSFLKTSRPFRGFVFQEPYRNKNQKPQLK